MLYVLLHGLGGSAEDMLPIAARLPERSVTPRGPVVWGAGFSWFNWPLDGPEPTVADATPAAQELIAMIERESSAGESVVAVGWSQGAALIVEAMRLRPELVDRAVLGSGFSIAGSRPSDAVLALKRPRTLWVREMLMLSSQIPRSPLSVSSWHGTPTSPELSFLASDTSLVGR
jgi:phospholipase/carboxylesterase